MPRGDGTGPPGGGGPGTGRGMGGEGGGGRMGGTRPGAGPGGECVCPSCGTTASHQAGVPCYQIECPSCGTSMVRKQITIKPKVIPAEVYIVDSKSCEGCGM